MDARGTDEIFRFEGFHVDRRAGGLFRVDESGVPARVDLGGRSVAGEGSGLNVALGGGHGGSRTGSLER
jgi:hypothetical protein